MRNLIRKIIKESLYNRMEKDFTLRSGKVLPNFKGIITSLTTNPSQINQAISIMEMLEPYSLYSNDSIKSNVQKMPRGFNPYVSEYSVSLCFSDMQVARAINDFIKLAAESYPWKAFLLPTAKPPANAKIGIKAPHVELGRNKEYYIVQYYIRIPENKE